MNEIHISEFPRLASVQRRASYELDEHHMNEIQISEFPPFGFSSTKEKGLQPVLETYTQGL